MTWEEIIVKIRKDPSYADLVKYAYFDEDLLLNVNRFKESEEFTETLKLIETYHPTPVNSLLDVGAGNGISSASFALKGYNVTALEPDKSSTIGAGAIRLVKGKLNLENLQVVDGWAESIEFPNETFDVVYVRQAMHHANNLEKFVSECSRVLKKGGLLLTIRDHVIYDASDKKWFLKMHPLHKFYGGENAFTADEYKNAIKKSGLEVKTELKFYDNIINFFPITKEQKQRLEQGDARDLLLPLEKKIGGLSKNKWIQKLYFYLIKTDLKKLNDEKRIPGRMYSYAAIKPL